MYTKRNYGFWMTFNWSKDPFLYGFLYAIIIAFINYLIQTKLGYSIALPWQPISVLGIAVAFYLGFKNNSSYDRTWEARKIWGGIVNSSRTFAVAIIAFVQGENSKEVKRQIIFRHLAWLTALRYQLRLGREWEHKENRLHSMFQSTMCPAYISELDQELKKFISETEIASYKNKANIASQILKTQSEELQKFKDQGFFEDFRHMALHTSISAFFDEQGRSERIKNFPFPRQYASVALWMTMIFSVLIPFGMLDIFGGQKVGINLITTFFSALLIWVFFLMEKIGDYSENPFEGTYNDVPISAIARSIEIDLKEMLGETVIPQPITPVNGYLL